MSFHGLASLIPELERAGHLRRITEEVDPYLEIAEIQRRAYLAKSPALLFERVKGSPFPALANLYGTTERCEFLFRKTLTRVKLAVSAKADPQKFAKLALRSVWKEPGTWLRMPLTGISALPKKISPSRAPVAQCKTTLDQLPQVTSWPMDGGPFVTLPQVFSRDPNNPSLMKANLGMYRVQMGGNDYVQNQEVGLHYQLHRGIGIHHTAALEKGEPLKVSIFIGGNPSDAFAAVMPLPEGLSELMFAGMLGGNRFRYTEIDGHVLSADADFCIVGTITGETKPEGPFGDHLGYYSLTHEFPLMKVDAVYHRKDAVWPFTVVGRPPQEDTSFGHMIHTITGPMVPVSLPGVSALHAVDAAGVHPLLLAVGSERYVPYEEMMPREILTQANAVLGFNQCSLAKYLMMASVNDSPPDIEDLPAFLQHMLERCDWRRDLHFQTQTTMDTLDYSSIDLNEGSKVVMAAAGKPIRTLCTAVPEGIKLPDGYSNPTLPLPGVLAVKGPKFDSYETEPKQLEGFCRDLIGQDLDAVAMITIVDDPDFSVKTLNNWLWETFTRSNPSHDVYGVDAFVHFKHWGCRGPVVIDARLKPHNAPPLIEDPEITKRVDAMTAEGGCLHGLLD